MELPVKTKQLLLLWNEYRRVHPLGNRKLLKTFVAGWKIQEKYSRRQRWLWAVVSFAAGLILGLLVK